MTRTITVSALSAALVLSAGFLFPAITNATTNALEFTTTPSGHLTAGEKAEFVVLAPDSDGHTIALSDGGHGGLFYGASINDGCTSDIEVTSVTIASSDSQKAFCYSNTTAGTYTISASGDSVDTVTSDVTVDPTTVAIVSSTDMHGWYFYNDQTDGVLSASDDHGFVAGPPTAPAGAGSVHLTKTTTDKYGIATIQFKDMQLSDITSLSFSTYRASGTAAQAPSLGFDIDVDTTDATTSYQGRLTYEPYFTQTVNTGAWQTWDTQDDTAGSGTGNWWFSGYHTNFVPTVCIQSNPCTWSEMIAAYPHIGISGQTILRTNGASDEVFDGNVDNLTIGTASTSTTYDFDPVLETTVSDGSITTLQSAIDSITVGGTVYVSGNYAGDLTISHGVKLKVATDSTASFTGKITVQSDDVTVSGLDITNPDSGYGIVVKGKSNVTLSDNTIHDIGTNLTSGSAQAIYLEAGSSSSISGDSFTGNTITNVGSENLVYDSSTGSSAKGIYIGDSSGTGTITNLVVSNNNISNVTASASAWPAGRGAYGVLTNFGGSTKVTIDNNTINNLSGLWAHAIGLEGNTPNTSVTDNTVTNLSDNKSGTDSFAVKFEDNNISADSVTMSGNTRDEKTVSNDHSSSVMVDGSLAADTDAGAEVLVNGSYGYFGQNAFATVLAAVQAAPVNGTVYIAPGDYNLEQDMTDTAAGQTGWYLPITTEGLTLQGVDASGNAITSAAAVKAHLYSTHDTANGSFSSQDLIAVFADNVSIKGLGIMLKLSPNKGIEIVGANHFTAENDAFSPISSDLYADIADYHDSTDNSDDNDLSQYGSGIYLNNNNVSTAHNVTITNNTFSHSRISFNTLGDHWTVDVSKNTFDGNAIWSADGSSDYYPPLAFSVGTDFTGSSISVHNNRFLNMASDEAIVKFYAGISGTADVTQNYWGSAGGPTGDQIVENDGTISFSPWYTDLDMTTLSYSTDTSSGTTTAMTGSSDTTLAGESSEEGTTTVQVTAVIPSDTTITGSSDWSGELKAPTATTTTLSFGGFDTTVSSAISIGSSESDLTFDKAVKLTFAGQAGQRIGWYNHAGVFTEISTTCSAGNDEASQTAALSDGGSCKTDVSGDLVVWTKHFSTFITYTTAPSAPILSPNGATFSGSQSVTLDFQAGTSIRYTTDGSAPICGSSLGYSDGQVLTFTTSTTLKAIRCAVIASTTVASSLSSATFTQVSSGGSGGGSGGGSISFSGGGTGTPNPLPGANVTVTSNTPSTPAQTGSQGEVLGAATYNFTNNLTIGSTGTDVTELQQILIAEGFDIPALTSGTAAYGYFGSQTRAAVSAYQKAHNISPSVGYVGPITRGQLNIGTVPTGETVTTGGNGMTAAQINAIIGLLQSFNADASVIANVRTSLGV